MYIIPMSIAGIHIKPNVISDIGGIVKGYHNVICVITSIDHNQDIRETSLQQADVYRIVPGHSSSNTDQQSHNSF